LVMLRRLQRGPATKADLIAEVRSQIEEPYGDAQGRPLDRRFERDKRKLRDLMGAEIRYRRAIDCYELVDVWEPLLDLPDRALRALAFLQETFEPDVPMHDEVQGFLSLLMSYLSPERRGDLARQRTELSVAWGRRDDDAIDPVVEHKLRKAYTQRRRVSFDYYSPAQADQQPRHHVVEPWELYFDSVRGHYYMRGYCLQTTSEAFGTVEQRKYIIYRMGRIHNVTVLPEKLPPQPRYAPKISLIYRLAPAIARRGEISRHPGITVVDTELQEDGSVVVQAETDNVWWAVRTLLHYGSNCEVLGGREARYEAQCIVQRMAELYEVIAPKKEGA
jgi:predicted DNA-binding transcriptional regulator YafY